MLGPSSEWVKNVEAAHGRAVIRHGRRPRDRLRDSAAGYLVGVIAWRQPLFSDPEVADIYRVMNTPSALRTSLFLVSSLLSLFAARPSAHAAEPHSRVTGLELRLGSVGTFTHATPLAQSTIELLVDPQYGWWTWQGGKLIVPSCNVTLGGDLSVEWEYGVKHNTSALHWTLGSLGGAELPLKFDHPNDGPGANVLVDDNDEKTWHITIPLVKGKSAQNLQAWTSKKGERSPAKSLLMMFNCEEAPPPQPKLTLSAGAAQGLKEKIEQDKRRKLATAPRLDTPQLEIRRLKLDVGLPDANALEWFKGQSPDREILFHEATGSAFERGGAQWGATTTITVGGHNYQSRGIDSCSSALKLNAYLVGALNGASMGYPGASANDLEVGTTGPSGARTAKGKVGPVPAGTQSSSSVNVASSGFVFFPSGSYVVSAKLLPPAASSTPANNTAQLNVVFKCKPLNSETWN